jgi:hypothetical protein
MRRRKWTREGQRSGTEKEVERKRFGEEGGGGGGEAPMHGSVTKWKTCMHVDERMNFMEKSEGGGEEGT